jgi:hypothetical protein
VARRATSGPGEQPGWGVRRDVIQVFQRVLSGQSRERGARPKWGGRDGLDSVPSGSVGRGPVREEGTWPSGQIPGRNPSRVPGSDLKRQVAGVVVR